MPFILAIDQGTTSTRALVIDETGQCRGAAQREFTQHFPQPGWVEHDAGEIWQSVREVVPRALAEARIAGGDLAAIGITNQRETAVLWERSTSRPAARAVVWQDRRTADFCRQRKADEPWLKSKTGLVLDPYFSATKIRWLLEQDAGLRRRAEAGELACGTIDAWLIWQLTGGRLHATDFSNASRTLLLDIHRAAWDDELCKFFSVPRALLPDVRPSAGDFGVTRGLDFLPDGIPIGGVAGDQQAALFGQGGLAPGDAKCTYGTGAFFLLHTGARAATSRSGLLTSLAAMTDAAPQYVLEGSVFIAGAAVQWLRDGMRFIEKSADVEALAAHADAGQKVIFVPALVGLGAPHWAPEARGVIFGLTRNTTAAELAGAALDGVALQVVDLIAAADRDSGRPLDVLRVDGGMAENAWFLQRQADLLGRPVLAAHQREATALGAAYLAGLRAGVWKDSTMIRELAQGGRQYSPRMAADGRQAAVSEWRRAVEAVIRFYAVEGAGA
jgi:glycerol kinase